MPSSANRHPCHFFQKNSNSDGSNTSQSHYRMLVWIFLLNIKFKIMPFCIKTISITSQGNKDSQPVTAEYKVQVLQAVAACKAKLMNLAQITHSRAWGNFLPTFRKITFSYKTLSNGLNKNLRVGRKLLRAQERVRELNSEKQNFRWHLRFHKLICMLSWGSCPQLLPNERLVILPRPTEK